MRSNARSGAAPLALAALLLAGLSSEAVARQGGKPEEAGQGREHVLRLVVTDGFEAETWRERLSVTDIDAREIAYREFLALASRSRAARLALESWAVDPTAPELAWTARLALRELLRDGAEARSELFWVPRSLQADPLASRDEDGAPAVAGELLGGGGAIEPVPEFESLRGGEVAAEAPFDAPSFLGLYAPRVYSLPEGTRVGRIQTLRDFKLDVVPEGVILLIVDHSRRGATATQYAAESLAGLIEEHPELRDQVPGLMSLSAKPLAPGSQLTWRAGRAVFRTQGPDGELPPGPSRAELRGVAGSSQADFLGVKCTPVSSEEGVDHCLGPGVGLRIEYREYGTIASALGLRRGDILVELCGEPLCDVAEISRIMSERPGEEIEVKIIDKTGRERTLRWAPRATAVFHLLPGRDPEAER